MRDGVVGRAQAGLRPSVGVCAGLPDNGLAVADELEFGCRLVELAQGILRHARQRGLLTGQALCGGSQIGGQVIVVDMPAQLGSRVSSELWMRNLPAVVFATLDHQLGHDVVPVLAAIREVVAKDLRRRPGSGRA